MFKKYLSVFLSLVLIICAMVSVFTVNAGADMNADGNIDTTDLAELKLYLANN